MHRSPVRFALSLSRLAVLSMAVALIAGCAGATIRQLRTDKEMLAQQAQQISQDKTVVEEQRDQARRVADERGAALEISQRDVKRLTAELETARTELAAARLSLNNTLDSRSREMANRIEAAVVREQELKSDVERLETRVDSLGVELTLAEEDRNRATAALAEAEKRLAEVQGDLTEARRAGDLRDVEVRRLESDRRNQGEKLAEMEKQLAAAQQEGRDLQSALRMAQDQVRGAEQAAEQARQEVATTQSKLGEAEQAAQKAAANAPRAASPEQVEAARRALASKLAPRVNARAATITTVGDAVRVSILSDELFAPATTILSDGGLKILSDIEDALAGVGYTRLVIEGHTDNVPVRNMPYPDNWELAAARATEVVRWLAARPTIGANRIVAQSHSYFAPVGENSTADGRRLNRRVVVVVQVSP